MFHIEYCFKTGNMYHPVIEISISFLSLKCNIQEVVPTRAEQGRLQLEGNKGEQGQPATLAPPGNKNSLEFVSRHGLSTLHLLRLVLSTEPQRTTKKN